MAELIAQLELIKSNHDALPFAVDELFRVEIDGVRQRVGPVVGAMVFILIENVDQLYRASQMSQAIEEIENRFAKNIFTVGSTDKSRAMTATRQMNLFRRQARAQLENNLLFVDVKGANHWLLRKDATQPLDIAAASQRIMREAPDKKLAPKRNQPTIEIKKPAKSERSRLATLEDKRAFMQFITDGKLHEMNYSDFDAWCRERRIMRTSLDITVLVEVAMRAGYLIRIINRHQNGQQEVVYRRAK